MHSILKKSLKISAIYFAIILSMPLVFFSIVLYNFYFFPHQEVEFFPLNDAKATYRVTYKYNQYSLDYNGKASVISHTAYILHSPIDLKPYIGKKVEVTGAFITSDTQCIARQCTKLEAQWSGVRIDTIYTK